MKKITFRRYEDVGCSVILNDDGKTVATSTWGRGMYFQGMYRETSGFETANSQVTETFGGYAAGYNAFPFVSKETLAKLQPTETGWASGPGFGWWKVHRVGETLWVAADGDPEERYDKVRDLFAIQVGESCTPSWSGKVYWIEDLAEPGETPRSTTAELLVDQVIGSNEHHSLGRQFARIRKEVQELCHKERLGLPHGKRRSKEDQNNWEYDLIRQAFLERIKRLGSVRGSQLPEELAVTTAQLLPDQWERRDSLGKIEIPGLGIRDLKWSSDKIASTAWRTVHMTNEEVALVTAWPYTDVAIEIDNSLPWDHWSHTIFDKMYTARQRWHHAMRDLRPNTTPSEYSMTDVIKTVSVESRQIKAMPPTGSLTVKNPSPYCSTDLFAAVLATGDAAEICGECGIGYTLNFAQPGTAHVVMRRVSAGTRTRYYIATVSSDGTFGPAPANMAVSDDGVAYWES